MTSAPSMVDYADALLNGRGLILRIELFPDGLYYWETYYDQDDTPHDSSGTERYSTPLQAAEAAYAEHGKGWPL